MNKDETESDQTGIHHIDYRHTASYLLRAESGARSNAHYASSITHHPRANANASTGGASAPAGIH